MKKNARPPPPRKERPAWYAEAGLGGGSPPPSPLESQAGSSSSRSDHQPLRRGLTVFNHTERDGTPPPEFTPVGPALDGPPYETIVMSYGGQHAAPADMLPPPSPSPPLEPYAPPAPLPPPPEARASPAPSERPAAPTPRPQPRSPQPLPSIPRAAASVPDPLPAAHAPRPQHPAHAQTFPPAPASASASAPSPPVPRQQPYHRHTTTEAAAAAAPPSRATMYQLPPALQANGPRVTFNPQSAYAKPPGPTRAARVEEAEPVVADASAFYRCVFPLRFPWILLTAVSACSCSNAVSAHFSSYNVPARMRRTSYFEQ